MSPLIAVHMTLALAVSVSGVCVIAGLFTLLPRRLLGHMLWHAWGLV